MKTMAIFKTNGKYYHIIKDVENGVEHYGIVINDNKNKLNEDLDYSLEMFEFENLTTAMSMFLDFNNLNVTKCNTSNRAVYVNDNFECMHHMNEDEDFTLNLNSISCPEWTTVELPSNYIKKIVTKKSVTYIKKLKNGVVLVD